MRILISHPFYWPYTRRGAERYIHELSQYLSTRRHDVTIVTSKPGRPRETVEGAVRIRYAGEFRSPILYRLGITPELSFMAHALSAFYKEKHDLIHSLFFTDGLAANLCGKIRSDSPYVMTFAGVPMAKFFKRLRIHNYLIQKAFDTASAILVFSRFAAEHLWDGYRKNGIVMPGTVDLQNFYISKNKDFNRPKILCTASVNVPYKNVPLLVKAFERFKRKYPGAVLQLSGEVNQSSAAALFRSVSPAVRESIQILGVGKIYDLPRLYSEAAISVLPSINEAFGFVLIESLASGTPIVGTQSGGIPEIITDPKIGVLYKPNRMDAPPTNDDDLCDAMIEAVELAKREETSIHCRNHAQAYDWSVIGPRIEEVYKQVMI